MFRQRRYEPGQMGNPFGSTGKLGKGGGDVSKTGDGKVLSPAGNPGQEGSGGESRNDNFEAREAEGF